MIPARTRVVQPTEELIQVQVAACQLDTWGLRRRLSFGNDRTLGGGDQSDLDDSAIEFR